MRRPVLLLAATLVLAAQPLSGQSESSARVQRAFTTTAVHVRETPAPNGRLLATLPPASLVEVGDCDPAWCAIRFRGLEGFTARRHLAFSRPVDSAESTATAVQPQGRGYINSRGEWVPSPVRTPDGRPPAGASARCRDGTFSFSRSRSGTCSHHGGVAEWL
jgi:hypothetical protein